MTTARKANMPRVHQPSMELMEAILGHRDERELVVELDDGSTFAVKYRPLSWQEKTRCVSRATRFFPVVDDDGAQVYDVSGQPRLDARFELDVYNREALMAMVTESPIPLGPKVINNMSPWVGSQFEAIIPDPFSGSKGAERAKAAPSVSAAEGE